MLFGTDMLAQTVGGDSGPPPPTTPPPELPLDSSIYLLVAAALLYGIFVSIKRSRAAAKRA